MRVIAVDERQYRSEYVYIDETDESGSNDENINKINNINNCYKDIRNMVENREELNKLACENRGIYLLKQKNDSYFIDDFKTAQVMTYCNVKQLFNLIQTIDSYTHKIHPFFLFFIFYFFYFILFAMCVFVLK